MNKVINGKARALLLMVAVVIGVAFSLVVGVDEVSAASKPSKVTGLKVTATYNTATVSWSKAKNAKSYKVYRATKSNKTGKYGKYKLIKTTKSRSYKNTKLTTGNTYKYRVRAVNGKKYGSYSSSKSVTCKPQTTTLYTPSNSTSGVKLSWKNIAGESGYQIYRATSYSGSYSHIKTVSGTSYTDTTGTVGKTYYYKVRSYKYIGYGKYVYGSFSNIKSGYKVKPAPPKPAEPEAYLDYSKDGSTTNTTRIYIGQTWSNELNAKLNGGSAVAKTLSRDNSKYYTGGVEDIYCYDTEDFDNFLIVYVKGGKIIAWQTSGKVLGVYKGTKFERGTQASSYANYDTWFNSTSGIYMPKATVAAANIEIGDIYFGGIMQGTDVWDINCNHNDLKGEEKICEYTINALRVMNGWKVLEHNNYLYGDGETYGMLAWSKTQSAAGETTHSELSVGPLAGKTMTQRGTDIVTASGKTVVSGNENVCNGGCGEFAADMWYRSVGHNQNLMVRGTLGHDTEEASLQAAAVYPSEDGVREYWSWTIGYNKIDYGVYPPEPKVVSVADTTATLEWDDTVSQFEEKCSYTIECSTSPNFDVMWNGEGERASWSKTTYTVRDLKPNTKYYFRIMAKRQMDGFVATSEWSDVITFNTLETDSTEVE